MANSKFGHKKKMQNDPGASICTRKISKLYIKETIEVMSKGHRRQFEGAPICQRWNNLSTQKNHDSNVLKHYKFIKIHEFITIVLKNLHWSALEVAMAPIQKLF